MAESRLVFLPGAAPPKSKGKGKEAAAAEGGGKEAAPAAEGAPALAKGWEVLERFKGATLKGRRYKPIFDFFAGRATAFVVCCDEYVTDDSGTGVVHQARTLHCKGRALVARGAQHALNE